MTKGFESKNKLKISVNTEEINKIISKYKKIKKYQRSSLYTIKSMDGTEDILSSLLKEAEDNPL